MKIIRMLDLLCATFLALAFLTPTVRAQTTFTLTGVGSGQVLDGVYTSPYSGSIGGGPTISVICDDFVDESFVPEQWTANVTQLSQLSGSSAVLWDQGATLAFGKTTYNLSESTAYTVAAVLANDILNNTGSAQEDYSYALWELFDQTQVTAWLTTSYSDPSTLSAASTDLLTAINGVSSGNLIPSSFPNVTIYTYDAAGGAPECGTDLNQSCPATPPQEFIVVSPTPEPASIVLFSSGCVSIVFLRRKRIFSGTRKPIMRASVT